MSAEATTSRGHRPKSAPCMRLTVTAQPRCTTSRLGSVCVRSRKRPKWQTAIWGEGLHFQREVEAEVWEVSGELEESHRVITKLEALSRHAQVSEEHERQCAEQAAKKNERELKEAQSKLEATEARG